MTVIQDAAEAGIDLGLTHFAVLSDGRKISNPGFLRRAERKLRTAQKTLTRRVKGNSNREKARVKIALRTRRCRPPLHGHVLTVTQQRKGS